MKILKPTQTKAVAGLPEQAKTSTWFFRPIERPSFADSLKFPENITAISSKEVSSHLGYYTAMHGYAIAELSKVEIAHLRTRSICESRRKNISRSGVTYGKTRYVTDREIRLDRELELRENEAHVIEARAIEIRAYVEIFDKYAKALSRELTRRGAEAGLVR